MDFGGSEHSEEKVYEVYIRFERSWSSVSIGTGAASYKRLVQVSPIFSALLKAFWSFAMDYYRNNKVLHFLLLFTNGRQEFDPQRVKMKLKTQ